jgi:hypothetical protein
MTDFTETRSMLKKLAMAQGPKTAIGHACSNLLEMTENYSKTKDPKQRKQIEKNMDREHARLSGLFYDPR